MLFLRTALTNSTGYRRRRTIASPFFQMCSNFWEYETNIRKFFFTLLEEIRTFFLVLFAVKPMISICRKKILEQEVKSNRTSNWNNTTWWWRPFNLILFPNAKKNLPSKIAIFQSANLKWFNQPSGFFRNESSDYVNVNQQKIINSDAQEKWFRSKVMYKSHLSLPECS